MAFVARIGDDGRGAQAALAARLKGALEHAVVPSLHAAPIRAHVRVYHVPAGRMFVLGTAKGPAVVCTARGAGSDGAGDGVLGPAVHVGRTEDAEAFISFVHDARPRLSLVVEGTVLWAAPPAGSAARTAHEAFHAAHAAVQHAQSGAPLGCLFVAGSPPDGRSSDELAEDVLHPRAFPEFVPVARGSSLLHSLLQAVFQLM